MRADRATTPFSQWADIVSRPPRNYHYHACQVYIEAYAYWNVLSLKMF
ncbi:hypothetical protein [Atlantibacter hermannii]